MGKRYSKEQKFLMLAGVRYAESVRMPRTKLAWVLSTIFGKTDNAVYYQLREAAERVASMTEADWAKFDFDEVQVDPLDEEAKVELAEETLEQHVGEIVTVKVVSIRTFGAVCQVANTTRTLLLHVSEIADEYIDDVNEYLSEGDEFLAMLILSKSNSRLSLSSKRVGTVKRKRPRVGEYA